MTDLLHMLFRRRVPLDRWLEQEGIKTVRDFRKWARANKNICDVSETSAATIEERILQTKVVEPVVEQPAIVVAEEFKKSRKVREKRSATVVASGEPAEEITPAPTTELPPESGLES